MLWCSLIESQTLYTVACDLLSFRFVSANELIILDNYHFFFSRDLKIKNIKKLCIWFIFAVAVLSALSFILNILMSIEHKTFVVGLYFMFLIDANNFYPNDGL